MPACRALEELSAGDAHSVSLSSSKLEQLEYEARKAFEQYDAVDARNRLVASELERRWNEKLEEHRKRPSRDWPALMENDTHYPLNEEARILAMGDELLLKYGKAITVHRALKKMIFRTVVEEIVVRTDAEKKTLRVHSPLEGRHAYPTHDGTAAFSD